MPARIRALAFDFDGIILDSETLDYEAWQEVFQRHGCSLDEERWRENVGVVAPVFDVGAHLAELTQRPELAQSAQAAKEEAFFERLYRLPALPGIEKTMMEARENGLAVGVASNSKHDWVDPHLERLGLLPHLQGVSCRDDVEQGKPEPDVYQNLCRLLGTLPEETVALEDSETGCLAAEAAGCRVVWIPNRATRAMQLGDRYPLVTQASLQAIQRTLG